jgi:hypothetical protein
LKKLHSFIRLQNLSTSPTNVGVSTMVHRDEIYVNDVPPANADMSRSLPIESRKFPCYNSSTAASAATSAQIA